jgi:hypothetical protein
MQQQSPFVTPKRNSMLKINSSRTGSQSDLISLTPKIVNFSNFQQMSKVSKHLRSISYLPSISQGYSRNYVGGNISTLGSTKTTFRGLCTDLGKVFHDGVNIGTKIKKSKESKSQFYNKFLVKGYEKISDTESDSELAEGGEKLFAEGEKTDRSNVDSVKDIAKKIKKMKTLAEDKRPKFTTIDFTKPRSPPRKKRLTQRVSSNLQTHIDAIRTVNQIDLYTKIEINRSKIEKLAQTQRKIEMRLGQIDDPGKQVKVFKKLYQNEMTNYVNHIRSTRKEKYDYMTKLNNGNIIKEELEGNIVIPGTMMKDANKLISLQPRFVKVKFNRHFNFAELNEGNMMDIMLRSKSML